MGTRGFAYVTVRCGVHASNRWLGHFASIVLRIFTTLSKLEGTRGAPVKASFDATECQVQSYMSILYCHLNCKGNILPSISMAVQPTILSIPNYAFLVMTSEDNQESMCHACVEIWSQSWSLKMNFAYGKIEE